MKTTLRNLAVAGFALMALASCSKNNSVPVRILLTDNPADYDEVNVHVTGMQVKMNQDTSSWISLQAKDTTINLLDLQNGVTTLIANGEVPEGNLSEVRLILGTGNNVVVNGVSHDLATPSAESSGWKIKVNRNLTETMNTLVVDFDAAQSVKENNGTYKLDPVLQLKN